MSHHFRSYSEQPSAQITAIDNQSIIHHYSDSQQSLDRLFNPPQQATVPLRDRNLPVSFFNPGYKPHDAPTNNGNHHQNGNSHNTSAPVITNNFHTRSVSFDQRPGARFAGQSLHTRTQSTVVPMPTLHNSSNQSSHEFLNYETSSNHNSSNNINNNGAATINHQASDPNLNGWTSHDNNSAGACWSRPQPTTIQPQHHHHHHHHLNNNQPLAAQEPQVTLPSQPIQPYQRTHPQQQQVFCNQTPMSPTHNQVYHHQATQSPSNHAITCNNHVRSLSFDQRSVSTRNNQNFHSRTLSMVPVPAGPQVMAPGLSGSSTHSSHLSSQECLYYPNTPISHNASEWTSSGYSTDDMSNACWTAGQSQTITPSQHPSHTMQPQPQQATSLQPTTMAASPTTQPMYYNI